MDETLIPFQVSMGVMVVGSFVDEEDPEGYVWIRRFPSEQERELVYEKIYTSDRWNTELLPAVVGMIYREESVISRLNPTPRSVIR